MTSPISSDSAVLLSRVKGCVYAWPDAGVADSNTKLFFYLTNCFERGTRAVA
jgi:hypothetical protein